MCIISENICLGCLPHFSHPPFCYVRCKLESWWHLSEQGVVLGGGGGGGGGGAMCQMCSGGRGVARGVLWRPECRSVHISHNPLNNSPSSAHHKNQNYIYHILFSDHQPSSYRI